VEIPKTRYVRSADGTFIAYQVFGDGPVDLLWISPWFSDLEALWEYQPVARFHREIAGFARLILMDQRGVGLSDRSRGFPDLETRMDDLRAVLDAAESAQTVLWGAGPDGGALCAMFAATYPERVQVLAFWNARAKSLSSADYIWGDDLLALDEFRRLIELGWGVEEHTAEIMRQMGAPSVASSPAGVQWAARVCRRMGAPGDVLAFDSMWREIDFRAVLPAVHVPTVAVYRAFPGEQEGTGPYEDLVARVPGAKAVELAPAEFPPWGPNMPSVVAAVREFVAATVAEQAVFERVLATVVFTDIVDSTAVAARLGDADWRKLVEQHHHVVRSLLARYRGHEVDTAGDGFFATFDGPARAVRCACAVIEAVQPLGLQVRAGVHTGEVETVAGKAGGLAVVIGARIGSLAGPSQVYTSQTVKDLTAGSGVTFIDEGERELKGVPERWRVYRVGGHGHG
jgi:class 3 adenylate cyclase/pimeloyl-ACP methyl ester carboxylesterase